MLITLDPVIRINKKYYPQTLLKECKYNIKNNKRDNLINDDLQLDNDSEFGSKSKLINIMDLIMYGWDNSFCLPLLDHSILYKKIFMLFVDSI